MFVASPAQLMGTITMDVFGVSQGALVLGDAEAVHHSVEAGGIKVWGMDKATVVAVWTAIILLIIFLQPYFQLIRLLVEFIHSLVRYYSLCQLVWYTD